MTDLICSARDSVTLARSWSQVGHARTTLTCAFDVLEVPDGKEIMTSLISFSTLLNNLNDVEKEVSLLEKEANAAWPLGTSASQLLRDWDKIQRKRAAAERALRYKNQLQEKIDALRAELIVTLNELVC